MPLLTVPDALDAENLTNQNPISDLVYKNAELATSSDILNSSDSFEDKESTYVGGEMVQSYHETNHSQRKIVVWDTDLQEGFILRNSSQYEVIIVSTYLDYKKELMGFFAACIIGSVSNELSVEDRAELSQESISWVAKGNLLIIGNVGLIMSGLHNEIGVVDIFTLSTKARLVQLLSTTALVDNLPLSQMFIANESHGLVLEGRNIEISCS